MTWPQSTLGAVATWGSGGTPRRSVPEYFGPGVPWVSIADLNDGVVTGAKESLTSLGVKSSSAKVVPAGTLLVAMYGSIGKLGIAGTDLCTSQAIAFAKPDPGSIDLRYLFHYLRAQRPHLERAGRGGTQMNIGQADLKSWPIPLPPMGEQQRIAGILDRSDTLRARRHVAVASVHELSRSIFQGICGDPVHGKIGRETPLGEVASVQIGPFGSLLHREDYTPGGVPLINPMHIRHGQIEPGPDFTVSPEKAATLSAYKLRRGDVVMGRRGEMGRCAIAGPAHDGMLCGTGSIIIRPADDRATAPFLAAALSHPSTKLRLEELALGATLPNLNSSIVKGLRLQVPPYREQEELGRRLAAVQASHSRMQAALQVQALLVQTLQAAAFTDRL